MLKKTKLILSVVGLAVTLSARPKVSQELLSADPATTVQVIIQWKPNATVDKSSQVGLHGGKVKGMFPNVHSAAATMTAAQAVQLSEDPDVAGVTPDHPVRSLLDYTAAAVDVTASLLTSYNGSGIGVAVIDSGITPSPDLPATQLVYNQDFTGEIKPTNNVADAHNAPDLFGHGEHVAGIIASDGHSSSCARCTNPVVGLAPGVKLINLRVLDENGNGSDSTVIAAIDRAIALKDQYNIKVINLSLGRPVYESYTEDPLCQAVEQAWQAGITVVVAAGNNGRDNSMGTNGYGTITAPGNDPSVITVGAMKTMQTLSVTDDAIASYSSKGPTLIDYVVKPDLVAPGNIIVSLLASNKETLAVQYPSNIPPVSYYNGTTQLAPSPTYFILSGTSMATPVVTAAAADLLSAEPGLTPDQIKARLMLTARKTFPSSTTATDPTTGQTYTSYYDPFTVGAGYLDIGAAIARKGVVAQGSALSPTAAFDAEDGSVYIVGDPSAVWTPAGWGTFSFSAVWGNAAVSAQNLRWGSMTAQNLRWGSMTAQNLRWGSMTAMSLSAPTLSDLSGGLATPSSTVSANSATAAEATAVTIRGEQ